MPGIKKIAMGGGCHWCTEAVFQSLKGVIEVAQGYVASTGEAADFSEGVLLSYRPEEISLDTLLEIHLRTHRSTSEHSFRKKYRSAVYFIDPEDKAIAVKVLRKLQMDYEEPIITKVLPFEKFEASRASLQDYYFSDPEKPFCQRHIEPKIKTLLQEFSNKVNRDKFG